MYNTSRTVSPRNLAVRLSTLYASPLPVTERADVSDRYIGTATVIVPSTGIQLSHFKPSYKPMAIR